MIENEDDRRQFFRMELELPFAFQIARTTSTHDPVEQEFADAPVLQLQRQLRLIDHEQSANLRTIGEQSRELGHYLSALNQKLLLLTETLSQLCDAEALPSPQRISLSEGGVGFTAQQPLRHGQLLALKLVLNGAQLVTSYARVIECLVEHEQQRVSCEFIDLSEIDRQLIARTLLHAQAVQRRAQHHLSDPAREKGASS